MNAFSQYITVTEAANWIGCTPGRVRQLLWDDVLQGEKWGNAWMVKASSVRRYVQKERSGVGRPRVGDRRE